MRTAADRWLRRETDSVIHKTDGPGYVISSHGCWLPGVYETERAARFAFSFHADVLQSLTDRICNVSTENRLITSDDLKAAKAGD